MTRVNLLRDTTPKRETQRERARQHTARYRARHAERVRAAHREEARKYYEGNKGWLNAQRRQRRAALPGYYARGKPSPEGRRAANLKKFGLTIAEYDAMLLRQGNACAICRTAPRKRRLDVDHCHTTGAVRGLLCPDCNRAIGMLRDSVTIMQNAITYLSTK